MAGHLGSNELNLMVYKYLLESGEAPKTFYCHFHFICRVDYPQLVL